MRGICTTAMCLSISRSARHLQPHNQVQRFVEQLRKRMRRVNRQRRQHRADLRAIILLEPVQVGRRPAPQAPGTGCRCAPAPAAVLRASRRIAAPPSGARAGRSRGTSRVAVSPSIAALDHVAFDLLLEPGDAHLEELIEVRADDAEELHPLQQRVLRIQRLVQHALVELQPAQFAIDEVLRFESVSFTLQDNRSLWGWRRVEKVTIRWRRRTTSARSGHWFYRTPASHAIQPTRAWIQLQRSISSAKAVPTLFEGRVASSASSASAEFPFLFDLGDPRAAVLLLPCLRAAPSLTSAPTP